TAADRRGPSPREPRSPDDSAEQRHAAVAKEHEKQPRPGVVRAKRIVEFWRRGADPWQTRPRDADKVVVLVVIAGIEADAVERSVIRIRLLARFEDVVFLDPSGAERMQSDREDHGHEQILDRSQACPRDER